ncbi:MAG: hypothetical protein HQ513_17010 [Rhodospirillales bacterium]|nr:hypothetical protein [Rhodospirillales bacterium]
MNKESIEIAPDLELADVHLHSSQTLSPITAMEIMDKNNVRWAGGGVVTWPDNMEGRRDVWELYNREMGSRFIAFAGQSEMNSIFNKGGSQAMADADNVAFKSFIRELDADLGAGRVMGVGTYFINNSSTDNRPAFRRRVAGNAPSVKRIYEIVAKYGSVLRIHMEWDPETVAQFDQVIASDRRGRVLWNQCGSITTADQARSLLERHQNLYCEISWRFPPVVRADLSERNIFDTNGPKSDWLKLIEDYPDRFMYGNDGHPGDEYNGATDTFRRYLLPYLKPDTARGIAFANAQKVFGLK